MANVVKWMWEETRRVIPAVIYFCIAFNLIYFTTGLTLPAGEERYFSYLTVTLSALIVGKILILANALPFINAFPHKPLVYNITWKFLIYGFLVFLVGIAHSYLHAFFKYDNLTLAKEKIHEELVSPLLWSTLIWLLMVFFVYVIFSDFYIALGREKVKKMLFG